MKFINSQGREFENPTVASTDRVAITDDIVARAMSRLPKGSCMSRESVVEQLDHAINGPDVLQVKPQEPAASPAEDPEVFKRTGELLRSMGVNISASGVASFLAYALHGEPEIDVTGAMLDYGFAEMAKTGEHGMSAKSLTQIYRAMYAARPKSAQ